MKMYTKSGVFSQCAVLFFALFFTVVAQAQLRVLIKFDETEHRIHRQVSLKSSNPELAEHQASQNANDPSPGAVNVLWLSADGTVLHRNAMADPRVTHAPLGGAQSNPTFVGLSDGAYMVSGPEASAILEVRFPENHALGLQAQTWQFPLNP